MKNSNYYKRRGITLNSAKALCKQLGWRACYWDKLQLALALLDLANPSRYIN